MEATKKITFYEEIAYLFGLTILAFGNGMMAIADMGLSTVIAPAYILHLKISQTFSWFTFGVSEYCLQGLLLLLTIAVLQRFKPIYLFSFVTAVLYGNLIDLMMPLINSFGVEPTMAVRMVYFVVGKVIGSAGLAFMFHSYVSPQVYELFVKEFSIRYKFPLSKVKLTYDITSCIIAITMSFLFFGFGHFQGIKLGTVIVAFVNGPLIAFFGRIYEKHLEFKPVLKLKNC